MENHCSIVTRKLGFGRVFGEDTQYGAEQGEINHIHTPYIKDHEIMLYEVNTEYILVVKSNHQHFEESDKIIVVAGSFFLTGRSTWLGILGTDAASPSPPHTPQFLSLVLSLSLRVCVSLRASTESLTKSMFCVFF